MVTFVRGSRRSTDRNLKTFSKQGFLFSFCIAVVALVLFQCDSIRFEMRDFLRPVSEASVLQLVTQTDSGVNERVFWE